MKERKIVKKEITEVVESKGSHLASWQGLKTSKNC